jgi:two-component system, NarL family, response regulator DesR
MSDGPLVVRSDAKVIRVALGHGGPLLRAALSALLSREHDLDVVAELSRTDEVMTVAPRAGAHVVVLEYRLPGPLPVVDVCHQLGRVVPECGVLLLLEYRARCVAEIGRSLSELAPRVGVLATEATGEQFVDGVRRVARGEPVLDAKLALAVLSTVEPVLTGREREVLRHAMRGATSKEIAKEMCLSTGTVRNYLSRVLSKTGARTRIEAVRIAQDSGWI